MNKHLLIIAFTLTISFLKAQNVTISDANFKAALLSHNTKIDLNDDKEIQVSEAQVVKFLNLRSKAISNLAGIESFTSLIGLNCEYNQIGNLDVSKNTALNSLACGGNKLTILKTNTALIDLNCDGNYLVSLDLSQNLSLTNLICGSNLLTTLDLSNNINLFELNCSFNRQLTTLGLGNNPALTYLKCIFNKLTKIDVSSSTLLKRMECDDNQLVTLDVSKNTELEELSIDNNQLTSLDVSKNIFLINFSCLNNQLTKLDISKNTKLTSFVCAKNQLNTLDLSNITEITYLLQCHLNPNLSTICISDKQLGLAIQYKWWKDATSQWSTTCSVVKIPDTNFKATLIAKGVDSNKNGEIETSEALFINRLDISNASIKSLKGISAFTNLTYLNCSNNFLDSLDVNQLKKLDSLNCSNNILVYLNVGNTSLVQQRLEETQGIPNVLLVWLNVSNNLLAKLDVSNYSALKILIVDSNPNLNTICINSLQTTNSWKKDAKAVYSTTCGTITGIEDGLNQSTLKTLTKILNPIGQEIQPEQATDGLFIYQFSDGSVKKVMRKE